MGQDSKIEWTHHTINLWEGCVSAGIGCNNCYAERLSHRWGKDLWGNDKPRKASKSAFKDLLRFQKLAKEKSEIHRVFVGSMMDIFEKPFPVIDSKGNEIQGQDTGFIRDLFFQQISNNIYPNLLFLLLTKRPSNINKYIPEIWKTNPPTNVMFGTSPVNQETFDLLTRQLKEVNGLRFLSVEPQLSEINLNGLTGINWLIQGGESGPHKRPFSIEWARQMRDECKELAIPYFFKQIDKVQTIPEDLLIREFNELL